MASSSSIPCAPLGLVRKQRVELMKRNALGDTSWRCTRCMPPLLALGWFTPHQAASGSNRALFVVGFRFIPADRFLHIHLWSPSPSTPITNNSNAAAPRRFPEFSSTSISISYHPSINQSHPKTLGGGGAQADRIAMPPPQFPSDRARSRPGETSVPAAKRAPPSSFSSSASASASAKIARPASAPDLAALSAAARPRPPSSAKLVASASPPDRKPPGPVRPTPPQQQQHHGIAPQGAAKTLPPSTPAKNGAPQPRGPAGPSLRRPPAAAARDAGSHHGKPASFMAPRGAQTVRPSRRLASGTAVYVRTTFRPRNINCRILLWLPARVVSAPDAYHLSVKYAADLNDMFAGKIVTKPVEHVRVAPHRTAVKAAPEDKAPSFLSRR
ncbi:unnamed protein product [Urochloa humidicola]